MVVIKKKNIKAYILLESLLALAILATISSLILGQINHQHQQVATNLKRQEILTVANMAVQTGQDRLSLNGITVQVLKTKTSLRVIHKGEEVVHLVKN